MVRDAVPLGECGRALVVKLRHHGDVLLATPVLSLLKARAPRLEVDALVYDDTRADARRPSGAVAAVLRRPQVARARRACAPVAGKASAAEPAGARATTSSCTSPSSRAARGSPGCSARATASRRRCPSAASSGRRASRHLYPLVTGNRRHQVELNLDALRRIGVQPALDGAQRARSCRAPDAERRIDQLVDDEPFVHMHPGVALALQVLAGGAQRRADRPARGRRPSRGAHRRRPTKLAFIEEILDKTKAKTAQPRRPAHHQGARRAHRAREAVRRRGLDADAPRRGDGHADARAVRPERRDRVGAVERRAPRGHHHAHLPPVRPRRLRRRQGVRVPRRSCRSTRCTPRRASCSPSEGGHRAPALQPLRRSRALRRARAAGARARRHGGDA